MILTSHVNNGSSFLVSTYSKSSSSLVSLDKKQFYILTLTYILCSKLYSEYKKQGSHQSAILTESLETLIIKYFYSIYLSLRDIKTTVSKILYAFAERRFCLLPITPDCSW